MAPVCRNLTYAVQAAEAIQKILYTTVDTPTTGS